MGVKRWRKKAEDLHDVTLWRRHWEEEDFSNKREDAFENSDASTELTDISNNL